MHTERQTDRFDRAKKRNLRRAGRVAPRRCDFDSDLMKHTKQQESRARQAFFKLLGNG
jgi:hypothetical protein